MNEIKPTMENLMDPYVLQIIEALGRRDDEIEWMQGIVDTQKQYLANKDSVIKGLNKMITKLEVEIEQLRAALWTEYQESFNDLGPTRQARWESADAYANALMEYFDRAALKGADESEHYCAWCNSPVDCGPIKGADDE